jgi:hypothetical protein
VPSAQIKVHHTSRHSTIDATSQGSTGSVKSTATHPPRHTIHHALIKALCRHNPRRPKCLLPAELLQMYVSACLYVPADDGSCPEQLILLRQRAVQWHKLLTSTYCCIMVSTVPAQPAWSLLIHHKTVQHNISGAPRDAPSEAAADRRAAESTSHTFSPALGHEACEEGN